MAFVPLLVLDQMVPELLDMTVSIYTDWAFCKLCNCSSLSRIVHWRLFKHG